MATSGGEIKPDQEKKEEEGPPERKQKVEDGMFSLFLPHFPQN